MVLCFSPKGNYLFSDDLSQTHINIGTGVDISVRELACLVKEITVDLTTTEPL